MEVNGRTMWSTNVKNWDLPGISGGFIQAGKIVSGIFRNFREFLIRPFSESTGN